MFYYESKTDGIYKTDTLNQIAMDNFIGEFDVFEDFLAFFADEISIGSAKGYDLQMLIDKLSPNYNYNLASDIVRRCKNMARVEKKFVAGRHK